MRTSNLPSLLTKSFAVHPRAGDNLKFSVVVVRLVDDELMLSFSVQLGRLYPSYKHLDCFLSIPFEHPNNAQAEAKNLKAVVEEFRSQVQKSPFHPDWLEDAYAAESVRVGIINDVNPFISRSDLERLAHKAVQSPLDEIEEITDESREAAMDYTQAQMIADFSSFLRMNWEGIGNEAEITRLVKDSFALLFEKTKGRSFLEQVPEPDLIGLIHKKLRHRMIADPSPGNVRSISDAFDCLMELEQYVQKSNFRNIWRECTDDLASVLAVKCPDAMLKGLPDMLAEGRIAEPADFTPFDGPTFGRKGNPSDINDRLSHQHLYEDVEDQGHEITDMLAGAMAVYFVTWMRLRHESKFLDELIELTRIMDQKSLSEGLIPLVEATRPNV